jgi:hypothetical protein
MVNGTLQILATRHNLTIDARWNGHCREWTVKNQYGEQLFKSDDYSFVVQRLESGEGLNVGSYPPQGWAR